MATEGNKHSEYWKVPADEIPFDVSVSGGFYDEQSALRSAKECIVPFSVKEVQTFEQDLPDDHPRFHPDQVYPSTRWVVLIPREKDR